MRDIKSTNTTLFLLPALGLHEDEMDPALGFIDAFLVDADRPSELGFLVHAVFKPVSLAAFNDFVMAEYSRTTALIEDYDYSDGFVVLRYQYPEKFHKDYKLFLRGRYSKFSQMFADCFPRYEKPKDGTNPNMPSVSFQRMVHKRAPALVAYVQSRVDALIGDECWSVPDKKRETLHIDRIRKKMQQ